MKHYWWLLQLFFAGSIMGDQWMVNSVLDEIFHTDLTNTMKRTRVKT